MLSLSPVHKVIMIEFIENKIIMVDLKTPAIWLHHYSVTAHYSAAAHMTAYPNPGPEPNPTITVTLTLTVFEASAVPAPNHPRVTLLHVPIT